VIEFVGTTDRIRRNKHPATVPSGDVAYLTVGYSLALVIASVDGKLLADDLQCGGGGPDSSVYGNP